jgi:hypothetical protein
VASLENCDMKVFIEKGSFIHNFIFAFDDMVVINRVMKSPLRMD